MSPYSDTNFSVALYLETDFTTAAEECLAKASAERSILLPATDLLQVEVTTAMQLHVFAAHHGGPLRITREIAAAAFSQFEEDVRNGEVFSVPKLDFDDVRREAIELSLRHSAKHGFRAYDVMHVASALVLKCDTFWSFDRQARKLAQIEGLALNPWPAG